MRIVLAFLLCTSLTSLIAAQTSQSATPASQRTEGAPRQTASNDDELRALEQDSQRMRAILNQMRQNLGFVGGTTTPLNHQFSLEIDMWQVALDQMDRRIARLRSAQAR